MDLNKLILTLAEQAKNLYAFVSDQARAITPQRLRTALKVANIGLPILGILCILSGFIALALTSETTGWPTAEGTIISSELRVKRTLFTKTETMSLTYMYRVDNMTYESSTISFEGRSLLPLDMQRELYAEGAKVSVIYDPAEPGRAVLEHQSLKGLSRVLLGFILAFLTVPVSIIRSKLKDYPGDGEPGEAPKRARHSTKKVTSRELAGDLMMAMREGADVETLRSLIERGADVQTRFQSGRTILHEAVRTASVEVVALLAGNAEILDLQDHYGETPLMAAVTAERGDVAQVLLNAGASVDLTDNVKTTVLMRALDAKAEPAVVELLARASDLEVRDSQGRTALLYALDKQAGEDVIALLLDLGAGLSATDNKGKNAMDYAARLKDGGKRLAVLQNHKAGPPSV